MEMFTRDKYASLLQPKMFSVILILLSKLDRLQAATSNIRLELIQILKMNIPAYYSP
jgi:hypothetical protein